MNEDSIAEAVRIIRGGGLIVFPTDTVYGLGCDPFSETAVRRLFESKRRDAKPVPVLCSTTAKADELVKLNETAAELAKKHWPGALTIVAPLKKPLPPLLTRGTSTLGVRVPGHRQCLQLIGACGGWITGTSANLSGNPSSKTAGEASAQLGDSVDLVLDGGTLDGRESTVVKIVGDSVTILRTGPVGVEEELKGRRTS